MAVNTRIGYHVHNKMTYGRDWSAAEKTAFIAHVERVQPATLLFLDDAGFARDIKRRLPDCAVIYRHYRHDDAALHMTLTPQQTYDAFAPYAQGGLILNILNEPGGYISANPDALKWLADWCAGVMRLFDRAGIAAVLPNWGVGHPDEKRFGDLDALWAAFGDMPSHYYGIHEYWTWRGINPGDGRVGRWQWWSDYMRRAGYVLPRVIVTEWGIDSALDGTPQRGYKDSRTGAAYGSECVRAIGLYPPALIVGTCVFSWGNTGKKDHAEDWVTFDVAADSDFQHAMEDHAMQNAAAAVNVNPGVDDPRWRPYTATSAPAGTIVRQNPTTASVPVTTLRGDVAVQHIPFEDLTAAEQLRARPDTHVWLAIKIDATQQVGWARGDVLTLTPLALEPAPEPEPPAPEPPAPEPQPPAGDYATRAEYNALLEKYMELQAALINLETRTTALVLREIQSNEAALLAAIMRALLALVKERTEPIVEQA